MRADAHHAPAIRPSARCLAISPESRALSETCPNTPPHSPVMFPTEGPEGGKSHSHCDRKKSKEICPKPLEGRNPTKEAPKRRVRDAYSVPKRCLTRVCDAENLQTGRMKPPSSQQFRTNRRSEGSKPLHLPRATAETALFESRPVQICPVTRRIRTRGMRPSV